MSSGKVRKRVGLDENEEAYGMVPSEGKVF